MSSPLPLSQFKRDATRLSADLTHRERLQTAMGKYQASRKPQQAAFHDWQQARQVAAETKWDALNHLDVYLKEFEKNATARGTKVHWASNSEQAREIIVDLLKKHGAKSVIKSKVMTSEEIHLNGLLEKLGYSVVESDLG